MEPPQGHIPSQLERNPAPISRGGNPVGGGREATHRLLSLAPAPDHSPHPPPRPRARHDLILCSKTPPCQPRVLPLQTGVSLTSNLEMRRDGTPGSQPRQGPGKTGSCHMHIEACGLYSCPPGIARDKVRAQGRNIRGLGLWVPPSVLPQTCSSEPGVYKVLMCDILWGRPKGSRAMSLDPDGSRRILLWEGRA